MRTSSSSSSAAGSERRRAGRGLVLALAAGLVALAACGERAPARRPNVILICLDTVRADHLGAYGYAARPTTPFLDELAARSILFADASATAGWTKPSVPSFLTGTMPCEHGVYEGSAHLELGAATDVLPAAALTLAEAFAARGYRTAAFVKNAQLRRGNGFEQGFGVYADEVGDARAIRWAGLDWIDAGRAEEPFFLYLHFLDAHWPYPVPDEYATRFAPAERVEPFRAKTFEAVRDAIHDGERELAPAEREALEAVYDGALRYLDDQLRLLADGLRLRGRAEDTILCVIADHGEEFGEHGRIGHGHGLWENLLRVPWILHVPGRAPARVEAPASLLDVFPTLLGAAGESAPAHLLGVDRLADPEASRMIFAEHKAPDRYQSSLRRGTEKLIRSVRPPPAAPGEAELPLSIGERWEAEIERRSDGRLVATQLKPRDEDPADPLEIKGIVEERAGARLSIAGFTVILRDDAEIQLADGATDDEPRPGRAAKVRGEIVDGVLSADRLKLYAAGEKTDLEVRGPIGGLRPEADGLSIEIGGVWIAVDAKTAFKDVPEDEHGRMSREDVVRLLELGAAAPSQGFPVEAPLLFDLVRDPGEREPRAAEPGTGLARTLEELGARLAGTRVFGAEDRILLTPEAVEKLRAIGYAR
ncbi:MAG: sulfatase [Planctomycetota bacterium]